MAELKVQVLVDRTKYDADIANIEKKNTSLEQNPIKLKFEATGLDAVSKEAIKLANAQTKLANAQTKLANAQAKIETANAKAATSAKKAEAATQSRIRAEKQLELQIEKNKVVEQELQMQRSREQQAASNAASQAAKTARADQEVAIAKEKTAQATIKATTANEQNADSADKSTQSNKQLESSYNKLGVTVANFAKVKVFQAITSGVQDSIKEMKSLDDELVTVRKVANATDADIAKLSAKSYQIGSKYGMAPSDYAGNVADFTRAGYRETANDLAELGIKTQLVGDTTQEVSTQFLLSVDAAYKYKGSIKELSAVLDGANAIDNNFATSIEKIAVGLGKVAPIASQAHVGVDELSAAIGTITAVTQRSGEEAATALRALFLNIMGDTKTEIADGATWTAGEIDGLRDILEKYAPAAVAAAEATGSIINPMEAMRGLAQSMKEGVLTEQELMQMVTDIGGKLRSSQLLAIVQNWDMYESMLAEYRNAFGSADAEIDSMMNSWTRKSEQVKTSFTKLMSGLMDSDGVKGGLDILRKGIELLDSDMGRAILTSYALTAGFAGLAKGVKALAGTFQGGMLSFGWLTVAATLIGMLAGAFGELFPTYEKLDQRAKKAQENYETEKNKLESIGDELEANKQRMAEIQAMGPLSYTDVEELSRLREATTQLQIQYDLQKKRAEASQREAAQAAVNAMKMYPGYYEPSVEKARERVNQYVQNGWEFGDHAWDNDVNSLIAEYEILSKLKEEAWDDAETQEYYDGILVQTKDLAFKIAEAQQGFILANADYYETLSSKTFDSLTEQEKNFIAAYTRAEDTIKAIYKVFDYSGYLEIYGTETEKAQHASDRYTESLRKQITEKQALLDATKDGSAEEDRYAQEINALQGELDNYNAALEEAKKFAASLEDEIEVKSLAEGLAGRFGLSEEATAVLQQQIRALAGFAEAEKTAGENIESTVEALTNVTEQYKSVSEAIEEAKEKYDILKDAMAELDTEGLISLRTLEKLQEMGIDLGEVLYDDVTGGYRVTADAIKDTYDATVNYLENLGYTVGETDEFSRALKEAQSELSAMKKALSEMGEDGDLFREYQDVYKDTLGHYNEGSTGTNAFAMGVRAIFNDEVLAKNGNDAKKYGELLGSEFVSGIFNAKTGDELNAFMEKNFHGTGAFFRKVGDEIEAGVTDWEEFSKSTGLTIELLQAMFGRISEYDNQMKDLNSANKDAAKSFDDIEKSVTRAENGIKKIKFSDFVKESAQAGKGVDEITEAWSELQKKASEKGSTLELEVDTEDAEADIQKVVENADAAAESDPQIMITADDQASETISSIKSSAEEAERTYTLTFTAKLNGTIPQIPKFAAASGTTDADAGPTLVNELGPELIVSRGRAFVAGDGSPTIIDLDKGDIVYNHLETEALLAGRGIDQDGIASKAQVMDAGTSGVGVKPKPAPNAPNPKTDNPGNKKSGNSKGGGGGRRSSGSGSRSDSETSEKEPDWWSIVQDHFGYLTDLQDRAIDRLEYQIELLENNLEDATKPLEKEIDKLDRLNDQMDRQITLLERQQDALTKPLQDEIDALEKAKDIQDEQLELAEKQKAVEDARNELQNAQNERTIRYFNTQKGQWEWMADKGAVANAEESLKNAEKDLADFEYEMHIRELERQVEQIEDVYEAKIEELKDQQTVNDDRIYDLEQQILAAEDAYNAAIEPLEAKVQELERQLKAITEAWAEAELPYEKPEENLSEALGNIGGSADEKAEVKRLIELITSASQKNMETVPLPENKTVPIATTKSTADAYAELFDEMGVQFGSAPKMQTDTGAYTSNVQTINDYSGAIHIGEITITADPKTVTLADLIDNIGIYVQR